ncbi:MAG TPA: thiamine-phosphate kinase [Thermoplasmata archaeon]|nr:thiamine-phosphate kinase [Thermoplasmata archaeon]
MTVPRQRRLRRSPAMEERAFHAWLAAALPSGSEGRLPLGDDAAAVRLPRGTVAVVSTDALVEGLHFRRASPPRLVGRAASATSLSDVAAKGAVPLAVFLAVIVPRGSPRAWAEQLVLGAEAEAARFGAHVLGGDTKPGPTRSVVSTVVGAARADRLVGRTGARPGDVLVTTGVVGRGGAAALALHEAGAAGERAVAGLLRVRPRVREGPVLARYASAMLDTSDGLAESARLLANASEVRLVVDERRLPLATALRKVAPASRRRSAAFYGGDYELLASVPPARVGPAARAVRAAGGRLTRVGAVERGRGAFLLTARGTETMPEAGWRPFGRPRP